MRAHSRRRQAPGGVTRRQLLGLAVGALSQLYAYCCRFGAMERDLVCMWQNPITRAVGGRAGVEVYGCARAGGEHGVTHSVRSYHRKKPAACKAPMPNLESAVPRPAGMSPRVATHCGALVALAGGSEGCRNTEGPPPPARRPVAAHDCHAWPHLLRLVERREQLGDRKCGVGRALLDHSGDGH